jgi:hypothetical protein
MKALSVGNNYLNEVTKHRPDKAMAISREVFIAASVEGCFDTIAKQLEQPAEWDVLIHCVWPLSTVRGRVGTVSRALVHFCGQVFHSSAVITVYQPNSALSWVLTGYPEICVSWKLKPNLNGTIVCLSLTWEAPGWVLSRFLCKIMHGKRVKRDLGKMLIQLKRIIEKQNCHQSYVVEGERR